MPQPTSSGAIGAERDLIAHTVNTGSIVKNTHLTLNVIVERLDHLAEVLAQPDGIVRLTAGGALEVAAGKQAPLELPANLLEAWCQLPQAEDATPEVQRRAYAAWLVTRYPQVPQEVAAREHYVPLAGWMNLHDLSLTLRFTEHRLVGVGPQRQIERIPLTDVTQALGQHPAFVLLGPPGCGKSTVLRRLTLEAARAVLLQHDTRLPFWINLANYAGPDADPLRFLAQHWATQGLPGDFVSLVRAGEVLLLADGLNEMARLATEGEHRRRANAWQQCLEMYFSDAHNPSRALLASRNRADYGHPLGLPRVEIDPLHDEQIAAFLQARLDTHAAGALDALKRLDLLEHARNPYQLSVLVALYAAHGGNLPSNRGRLFAQYADELIRREEHANHPHWLRAEAQLEALSRLGYAMQQHSESTVLPQERLLALVPQTVQVERETVTLRQHDVLDLACRAGILSAEPTVATEPAYKFSHQLLQESFAARHMLAQWQAGMPETTVWWQTPHTHRDMPPASVGKWDPLPLPPATGWEQVTILAAGMTDQPDAFVQAMLAVNPALAGRCLSDGAAAVSTVTHAAMQQALLADLGNANIHRRVRLDAGRVLGAVGDPRFTPQVIGAVEVIVPDLVPVPGGTATIGSARWPWDRLADTDERPRHQVPVAPFYLGRFPVTNAEYACFRQAGGYDTEYYWTTTGWQWRHGAVESSGPVEELLAYWQYFRQQPHDIDRRLHEGRMTPDNADIWRRWISQSEEEVRELLLQQYPTQPHDQPHYSHDPACNAPNQPVVGVTWYEAMAYCAWLHEQLAASSQLCVVAGVAWDALLISGAWEVRLPTEAEWEWGKRSGGLRTPNSLK